MKLLKIFSLCCFFALSSCFLRQPKIKQAQGLLSKGRCEDSYHTYLRIQNKAKKDFKFALTAAKSCEETSPLSSVLFYENFLKESFLNLESRPSFKEIKKTELEIARISFEKTKNYHKAIKFYEKSLEFAPSPRKEPEIRHKIIQSFFYLKKYEQTLLEIEKALALRVSKKYRQKILFTKGRVLIAQKDLKKALVLFKDLIQKNPDRDSFFREYTALIYEEQKRFSLAIKELEKVTPLTPFVKTKIQQLYERLKNQPGVRL